MGILNLTPDSFYDGGSIKSTEDVLVKAGKMISEGATILDLGAASTRPGSVAVSAETELTRMLPALTALRKEFPELLISIDTYWSKVALEACEAGADIINDISSGDADPEMMSVVGRLGMPYIMMHMKGQPTNMQLDPHYDDVVKEVLYYLSARLHKARKAGIRDIIIDPGFGFGKTLEHNYSLLARLEAFSISGCPLLAGISRKSMINKVLNTTPANALNGTTAANMLALVNGADILRVHDVKEAMETIKIFQAAVK